MRVVPSTELPARAITRFQLTEPRVLADLTSNAAAQFGVTAEIFTTGNYQLTQLWASALHGAGYAGIRYWARHDLAHTHACLALFDAAGVQTLSSDTPGSYTVTETDSLSERPELIDALQRNTGISILAVPQSL